jgi:uncharacterized RDD family membrane protein YckC
VRRVTDSYLLPIRTAALLFPGLALLMLVPTAVVVYRRHGVMTRWRTLSLFGGVYYGLTAFCLTIVPLPSRAVDVCAKYPSFAHPQWMPGSFVGDVWKEAHHRVTFHDLVLGNPAVWETVFNLALLLPLGVFVRVHARRGPAAATLAGFAGSLFFEVTQYTGLYGLYACPYRLFAVDDLLANTAGATLGWALAGPLARALPDLGTLDARALDPLKVPLGRRLVALLLDLTGVVLLAGSSAVLVFLVLGPGPVPWVPLPVWAVWFVLVPRWTGATPGKHVLLLRLVTGSGDRPGTGALSVRATALGLPFALLWFVAGAALPDVAFRAASAGTEAVRGGGYRDVAYALAADPASTLAGFLLPCACLAAVAWWTRAIHRHPEGLGPHEALSGIRNTALPHTTARRTGHPGTGPAARDTETAGVATDTVNSGSAAGRPSGSSTRRW